jgi:DnaJ-domain-containing protein 1
MIYLVVAGAVVVLALYGAQARRMLKAARWRIGSGAAAVGVLAAAGFVAVRGGGLFKALLLALIGLMLALFARWPGTLSTPTSDVRMSLKEARALLGVTPQADAAEIQAAYARLMRTAHPDRGGTTGLATQLNLARDRLLKSEA